MIEIIENLSLKDLRRISISGGGLNEFLGHDEKDIEKPINHSGMIQLDPIDPAGRNHDIFIFSRLLNYKKGTFEKVMYDRNKKVFEVYFPNLMAVDVTYYPEMKDLFSENNLHPYYQERIQKFNQKYPTAFNTVLRHIEKNGVTNSAELAHLGKTSKITTIWKTNRVSGAALELLWLLGKLAIVQRDAQFKKSYDLIERYFSASLLEKNNKKVTNNELGIKRFILRQKYRPLIFIGNMLIESNGNIKVGKTKTIDINLLQKDRNRIFYLSRLPNTKKGVFLPSNWELLLKSDFDNNMRAICPLDPIIHERELASQLFNFDYVWEIYKKSEQRKWGYYVYPLLYQDKFIGRFEVTIKKGEDKIKFFNFQKEKSIRMNPDVKIALKGLINRWVDMIGAQGFTTDNTLNFL